MRLSIRILVLLLFFRYHVYPLDCVPKLHCCCYNVAASHTGISHISMFNFFFFFCASRRRPQIGNDKGVDTATTTTYVASCISLRKQFQGSKHCGMFSVGKENTNEPNDENIIAVL